MVPLIVTSGGGTPEKIKASPCQAPFTASGEVGKAQQHKCHEAHPPPRLHRLLVAGHDLRARSLRRRRRQAGCGQRRRTGRCAWAFAVDATPDGHPGADRCAHAGSYGRSDAGAYRRPHARADSGADCFADICAHHGTHFGTHFGAHDCTHRRSDRSANCGPHAFTHGRNHTIGKGAAHGLARDQASVAQGADANSDIHASAEYRKHLTAVYAGRAITAAISKA